VSRLGKSFYIKVPHFYSLEYFEGDKKMVIEIDFRDRILYLDKDLITSWEKPFNDLEINREEKLQILNNIRECLLERREPDEVLIIEEPRRGQKHGNNA
jgi:hypothetical protein